MASAVRRSALERHASHSRKAALAALREQLRWPSTAVSSGKELQVSEKNRGRRWLVGGGGSGWQLELSA